MNVLPQNEHPFFYFYFLPGMPLAGVGPLVPGNVALVGEPFENKFETPRLPGLGLDFPPLPIGGTTRAWKLLHSACAKCPPSPAADVLGH